MTVQTHVDGYIRWLRDHVGNELIYLVYTTALVFDEKGHLLVQSRYDFDWLSIPGGALEMDEDIAACVQREVFEETGVTCEIEHLLGVFSHPRYHLLYPNGDQVQPWTVAFVCKATSELIRVDGKETLKAAFRPVDEVRHLLPPKYQDMLRAYETKQIPYLERVDFGNDTKPYYPILRAKVGHQRVILPGGTAVIFNEQGQVLAVHEKQLGIWGLPSGFADLGESSTATIVREVREETGLEVEPIRLLGIYSAPHLAHTRFANGDEAHLVNMTIECRLIGGTINADNIEVDGVQFMDLETLLAQTTETLPISPQMYPDLMRVRDGKAVPPFIR